ncbi:MAG: MFS transporter [Thermodesulfobacteriota bacterium]
MKYYRRVWYVLMLGWISLYMVRVGLSPLLAPIMKEFSLTYAQAGLLSSAVFWAYTFMQIPSGYMGDRWGHKRFLVLGTALWTVLCGLTGLAAGFWSLVVVRFFTGMAEGTYFGNDRPIIAKYTPREEMAKGQGTSAMGMGLGMGLGLLLAGLIAGRWGWRWVFFLYTLPSLAAFLLVARVVAEPDGAAGRKKLSARDFSMAFRSKNLWLLYLSGFSIMYMFWVLGAWAPMICLEIGKETLGGAGVQASRLGLVSVPALLLSGAMSDRFGGKKYGRHYHLVVCILFTTLLALLMGLTLQYNLGLYVFLALMILGGFSVWAFFPPFYALLAESAPREILGTTFGAANTVSFMASLAAPGCTGYLRDATRGFSWGFYLAALLLVFGAVCALASTREGNQPPSSPAATRGGRGDRAGAS